MNFDRIRLIVKSPRGQALAWAAGIAVLLMGAQQFVERTTTGQRIYVTSFAVLQEILPNFDPEKRLPIVVVDISAIAGGREPGSETPRKRIAELIKAIASAHPRAIGVDIDFSPNEDGWRDWRTDPSFFDMCVSLGRGPEPVPVFLGAYRARDDGPDVWLGSDLFSPLAADVGANTEPSSKVTFRASTHYLPEDAKPTDTPLKTMSFALAQAYVQGNADHSWPKAPRLLGFISPTWIFERTSPADISIWKRHEGFLLNYSKIDQLHHETLLTTTPTSALEFGPYFAHKIVILGDVAYANDRLVLPDRGVTAGVYAHAVGAYTFAVQPIYEFKLYVRLLLDALAGTPLLLTIFFGPRQRSDGAALAEARAELGEIRIARWSALGVVAAGIVLMATMRVMWLDFALVAAAQLLHPTIQRWIHRRRHGGEPPAEQVAVPSDHPAKPLGTTQE